MGLGTAGMPNLQTIRWKTLLFSGVTLIRLAVPRAACRAAGTQQGAVRKVPLLARAAQTLRKDGD